MSRQATSTLRRPCNSVKAKLSIVEIVTERDSGERSADCVSNRVPKYGSAATKAIREEGAGKHLRRTCLPACLDDDEFQPSAVCWRDFNSLPTSDGSRQQGGRMVAHAHSDLPLGRCSTVSTLCLALVDTL